MSSPFEFLLAWVVTAWLLFGTPVALVWLVVAGVALTIDVLRVAERKRR